MAEEDRGSGSSTLMIVLAILAGILILGCCGGIVAVGLGGGFVLVRSQPAPAQPQVIMQSAPTPPEVQEALDKVQQDLEPLKVPEQVEGPQPPPGEEPSAVPEPKDK